MQWSPEVVSTVGLASDIVGVVIVFLYGLPKQMPGPAVPTWGGTPLETLNRRKLYSVLSWTGMGLIVAGFALQILGEWL